MSRDWEQELADIEHTRVTTNDKTRETESALRDSRREAIREFPQHEEAYKKDIDESVKREHYLISATDALAANKSDGVKADRATEEASERESRAASGLEFKDPPIPPQSSPSNDNHWRVIEGKPPEASNPQPDPSKPGPSNSTPPPEPPKSPPPSQSATQDAQAPAQPDPPSKQQAPSEDRAGMLRDIRDSWVGKALDKAASVAMIGGVLGGLATREPAMTGPGPIASPAPISGPETAGVVEDEVKSAKQTKIEDDEKKGDWKKGVDAVNNANENAKSAPPPGSGGGPEPPREPQGPRQLTTVYGLELKPPPPPPPPLPSNDNALSEGKGK